MKHTKGPWVALTFSNHELHTDFAMVQIGGSVHMIGYSEQDFADAALIAAAPELLEALKYCLDSLGDEFALPSECIHEASAAIAKAEGL